MGRGAVEQGVAGRPPKYSPTPVPAPNGRGLIEGRGERQGGKGLEKERFLASVREALGKDRRGLDAPYPAMLETPSQVQEKARNVRIRLGDRPEGLLDTLMDVSQQRGWKTCRVANSEDAMEYICTLASSSGTRLAVRSDQQVCRIVPIDDALFRMGVEVTVMARASGLSADGLRARAAEAGMGITGADYAIAETGSVVVLPRRGLSRLVSLLPPIHVAIVRPEDVIESLEDLFTLRRDAFYSEGAEAGGYLNIITGPSRTADIEQTLVIGVHGPVEAHMVILESSA